MDEEMKAFLKENCRISVGSFEFVQKNKTAEDVIGVLSCPGKEVLRLSDRATRLVTNRYKQPKGGSDVERFTSYLIDAREETKEIPNITESYKGNVVELKTNIVKAKYNIGKLGIKEVSMGIADEYNNISFRFSKKDMTKMARSGITSFEDPTTMYIKEGSPSLRDPKKIFNRLMNKLNI